MLYTRFKKELVIILTFLWISIIFSFSLQPADDSSKMSSGLVAWLIEYVLSIFSVENVSAEQLDMLHLLVRKCAHFTEFFILGVLMYRSVCQTRVVRKVLCALCLCVLVAMSDETIQLFVDGRAGRWMDVLIDSCGSFTGIWIVIKMTALWKKIRQS